jgi:multiple sugar transport system substrate-binding protein
MVPTVLGATSVTGASAATPGSFTSVPASAQVNLTFLSYLPAAFAQGATTVNNLLAGFETAHPNIHVTLQSAYPTLPAVQQDEAAGTTPDVVQGTFDGWRYLVSGLGAVDLTQTFGQDALATEWGGTFPYAAPVQGLATENGDVYGVPWTLSTPVLFMNANLFKQAGLNPLDPPTTWSELKTDALQIKVKTGADGFENGCIGGGTGTSSTDWCLQAIIDSDGGQVLNDQATKLTFNTPQVADALNTMKDLADSGAMVNLTSAQTYQAFAQGKLAMILQTSAVQATLISEAEGDHFALAAAKMPGFGTQRPAPTNSGSGLFILSKRPLQQRAAWELITYLTSDSSMTAITEGIGYPPLRPGLANSQQYLGAWKRTNALVEVNLEQLKELTPYQGYPGPNYSQIVEDIANAATSITFENANTATTLTSTQGAASALMP